MAQIGTIKLQTQNSGTVSVPVFDVGDSGSSVYEFVRVQTANGTGFIPVTNTTDATYPYLRVQSQNNGIVAVTDYASAIPDGGVALYNFEQTVSDGWDDNDATNDGGSYTTDSTVDDYAISVDGGRVILPLGDSFFTGGSFSLAMWVKKNDTDTGNTNEGAFGYGSHSNGFTISYNDKENTGGFQMIVGDDPTSLGSVNIGVQNYIHLAATYDGSTGTFYYNGTQQGSVSGGINDTSAESYLGYSPDGSSGYGNMSFDDTRFYDKELSSTEVSNLYNTGSING